MCTDTQFLAVLLWSYQVGWVIKKEPIGEVTGIGFFAVWMPFQLPNSWFQRTQKSQKCWLQPWKNHTRL